MVMKISLLIKTVQPDQSNPKMHEGDGFSAKTLWKKTISFLNELTGTAMVQLASSHKWKAHLNSFMDFSVHAYFLNKECLAEASVLRDT